MKNHLERYVTDRPKEPVSGDFYYASPDSLLFHGYGHKYRLLLWRETLSRAKALIKAMKRPGYVLIVRPIAFIRGSKALVFYGVYSRKLGVK